jgi:hypothetical protein
VYGVLTVNMCLYGRGGREKRLQEGCMWVCGCVCVSVGGEARGGGQSWGCSHWGE